MTDFARGKRNHHYLSAPMSPGVRTWMDLSMLNRKRPLLNGYEKEPLQYTKKCLLTPVSGHQTDTSNRGRLKTGFGHCCTAEARVNGGINRPTDAQSLLQQESCWIYTENSVKKVMEHLRFSGTDEDIFLSDAVNKKFLEFHCDITEECGAECKQHSWAVIEKQEEVIMYGPYYPNYNNGEHSEDIIIKQTQELLESGAASEDWKVYVFTMNSPCLARNTDPCMLNLIQRAQQWWSAYGVKTHIGFVKCWGFKGTKENLFRDISYSQVDCIDQTKDYRSYVIAAETNTCLSPVCENVFSAVKHLLRSVSFPSILYGSDWKTYFKSMHDSSPEDEENIVNPEVNAMIEAAQTLLLEESESLEECLEKGQAFVFRHTFSSLVSDSARDQIRLTFQQCWKEMVRDKYAEFIREKLTEDFNQATVQLFIKDAARFTKQYLQIGMIRFPEDLKEPQK